MTVLEIRSYLFSLQDLKYKAFQEKLMPTVDRDTVIGVRTPLLRTFARQIKNDPDTVHFLNDLPHQFYEENNLHAFLVEEIADFEKCVGEIDRFLPYINNWATCDSMRPKCFAKNVDRLLAKVYEWMEREEIYAIRYGIEVLMIYFLDGHFDESFSKRVSKIRHEGYYVKMMVAWYFATALSKQYDAVVGYLESGVLDAWTHNKTIQKAIESYRISSEKKEYLRTLKRKG